MNFIDFLSANATWVYYVISIIGVLFTSFLYIKNKVKKSKFSTLLSLITEVPVSIKNIESHQKLLYSEMKLQGKVVSAILDTLDLAHFISDAKGQCIKVNSKWISITGLPESDALGHNWLLSVHPEDREHIEEKWQHMVDNNAPFEEVFRYQNRITAVITKVKCHATDVLDENSDRIFILGFSRILH